jgi:hypothetical protein
MLHILIDFSAWVVQHIMIIVGILRVWWELVVVWLVASLNKCTIHTHRSFSLFIYLFVVLILHFHPLFDVCVITQISLFSMILFSFCSVFPYPQCASLFNPNIDYFPVEILIITDGTCGSACSLFVTKFQKYRRATVLSHGGYPGADVRLFHLSHYLQSSTDSRLYWY